MSVKSRIDLFGAVSLTGFALLMAFNQVVIKVVNEGLQPIFFAALRSFGGAVVIFLWLRVRGLPIAITPGTWPAGLLIGALFAAEFIFLFLALDLTTVTRTSIIYYTMPVWLALAAHVLLPGERLTMVKGVGLALAFAGVVVALLARGGPGDEASMAGDFLALLAAIAWAGIALCARASALRHESPETQLLWQLTISVPILFLAAPLFGPLLREPTLIHWAGLGFQILVIVSAAFLLWLWLLSRYPATSVASFSFLSPVFGVGFGWILLGEEISVSLVSALALVCIGLVLINRPSRAR